jgi:hypothetical protein
MLGVAVAIDDDGDAVGADALRDLCHRQAVDVDEVFEGRLRSPPAGIRRGAAQAVGKHLQSRAIDLLPELQRQVRGRMLAKVRRYKRHPQPLTRRYR